MGEHHQYGLPDLRQLMAGRTHLQTNPPQAAPTEPVFLLQSRQNNLIPQILTHHHHYHHDPIIMAADSEVMLPSNNTCTIFPSTRNTTTGGTSGNFLSSCGGASGGRVSSNYIGWVDNDAGNSNNNNNNRWPRQETLTLLEIRSRLDSRFKEANQKGPLWDEISRIMAEEHGYHRSGKKCREKFENLYKYYKKTKEGKAGRQDGKHYRFFRQLEALYGETSNNHHQLASATPQYLVNGDSPFLCPTPNNTTHQEYQESDNNKMSDQSLSFSNTSEFETSSSDNNDDGDLSAIASCMMNRCTEKQKGKIEKKNWKGKVKDLVDMQMRKLLEKQEAWMERMLKTIEDKEQERMSREEEWTKQESARLDRIHELWAKEKAWIEARDVALMEVLNGNGLELPSSSIEQIALATQCHYKNHHRNAKKIDIDHVRMASRWNEPEIFSLIQIRTAMESRIAESGSTEYLKQGLWEETARKMACLGYDRSADECKEKWENMNAFFNNIIDQEEGIMKMKEDLGTSNYFQQLNPFHGHERAEGMNSSSTTTSSCYMGNNQMHGSSFLVSENGGREHSWNRYGLKLRKEKNQQP